MVSQTLSLLYLVVHRRLSISLLLSLPGHPGSWAWPRLTSLSFDSVTTAILDHIDDLLYFVSTLCHLSILQIYLYRHGHQFNFIQFFFVKKLLTLKLIPDLFDFTFRMDLWILNFLPETCHLIINASKLVIEFFINVKYLGFWLL